jgi:glutaredoxin
LKISWPRERLPSDRASGAKTNFQTASKMQNAQPEITVTIYVVPDCPLCAQARAWLKNHGIEYAERDVAHDFGALRAMHKLTRQRLVPVFEARGRALVRPSEAELAELLL